MKLLKLSQCYSEIILSKQTKHSLRRFSGGKFWQQRRFKTNCVYSIIQSTPDTITDSYLVLDTISTSRISFNPNLRGLFGWYLFAGGGALRAPPIPPLINPKLVIKLVHFSIESEKATNLWLIETFPSLFQWKIKFLQPYQNHPINLSWQFFSVSRKNQQF